MDCLASKPTMLQPGATALGVAFDDALLGALDGKRTVRDILGDECRRRP